MMTLTMMMMYLRLSSLRPLLLHFQLFHPKSRFSDKASFVSTYNGIYGYHYIHLLFKHHITVS